MYICILVYNIYIYYYYYYYNVIIIKWYIHTYICIVYACNYSVDTEVYKWGTNNSKPLRSHPMQMVTTNWKKIRGTSALWNQRLADILPNGIVLFPCWTTCGHSGWWCSLWWPTSGCFYFWPRKVSGFQPQDEIITCWLHHGLSDAPYTKDATKVPNSGRRVLGVK